MLEKFQILQNWCMIGTFVFTVFASLCGLGWNYYGKKINEIKGKEQKQHIELKTNQILDTIDSNSQKVIDVVKKTAETNKIKKKSMKKEETNINAPNALIVTSNQSGGNNTVINNYADKQRHLNAQEIEKLKNGIDHLIKKNNSDSNCSILVRSINGYKDSYNLAGEIINILKDNKYNVQHDIEGYIASPPNKGVEVSYYDTYIIINVGIILE